MEIDTKEEKNLIDIIYGYLSNHTAYEARGLLTEEGIKNNTILRGLFKRLLISQKKELEPPSLLAVGLVSLTEDKEFLQEVSLEKGNDWGDLPVIAKYFLEKKQEQK